MRVDRAGAVAYVVEVESSAVEKVDTESYSANGSARERNW